MITDQSTNTSQYRLYLFNIPPVAIDDGSPFTILWANHLNTIGYIDFPACHTENTGSDSAISLNTDINLPFTCGCGSTAIYGLLSVIGTFTPNSAQNFYIELSTRLG